MSKFLANNLCIIIGPVWINDSSPLSRYKDLNSTFPLVEAPNKTNVSMFPLTNYLNFPTELIYLRYWNDLQQIGNNIISRLHKVAPFILSQWTSVEWRDWKDLQFYMEFLLCLNAWWYYMWYVNKYLVQYTYNDGVGIMSAWVLEMHSSLFKCTTLLLD